mgnify:CR=1 FL=1
MIVRHQLESMELKKLLSESASFSGAQAFELNTQILDNELIVSIMTMLAKHNSITRLSLECNLYHLSNFNHTDVPPEDDYLLFIANELINTGITELILSGSSLTMNGARAIADVKQLSRLDFSRTPIDNSVAKKLALHTGLEYLDVTRTQVTDFRPFLQNNSLMVFRCLNLSWSRDGFPVRHPETPAVIAVKEKIKINLWMSCYFVDIFIILVQLQLAPYVVYDHIMPYLLQVEVITPQEKNKMNRMYDAARNAYHKKNNFLENSGFFTRTINSTASFPNVKSPKYG